MEDEEGYTTLNLRLPASVITDGYSSNNKCPIFSTPAHCVTVDRVSASSAIRQPATLAFFALSLVLLTGLVVLLSLFFQIYQDPEEGKKLQAMREALCFERRARNETECAVCPARWKSSEVGSCFYVSKQKKTWKESQEFCSTRNSTLIVLKDKIKMVTLPYDSQFYWVGLSYMPERNGWFWEDGTALSREAKAWTVLHEHNFCASLYGRIIYDSNSCSTEQFWICEKGAVQFA
ncbi:natural killer cells antigen CD94-like [Lagopus muta]|uniref:natural killer cells antigen CD94-like n=1 Tax=Lagopus muta TaxID=64668 RepID=UPI00209E8F89|nr:natural killer cells antigen CD94-like [Lagopus muta]